MKDKINSKKCYMCKKVKYLYEFSKNKCNKHGFQNECKSCRKILDYKHRETKLGVIDRIYYAQVSNSKRRGYMPPSYTKSELIEWVLSNNKFNELYDVWAESGHNIYLKPSVDRLNDYESYTFDNMRLITWGENDDKGHFDIKNGINNKRNKAVIQMSKKNDYVYEYYSLRSAERATGAGSSQISKCCKGVRNTAGGNRWMYSLGIPIYNNQVKAQGSLRPDASKLAMLCVKNQPN